MSKLIGITIRVLPDTQEDAASALEVVTRMMVGLAMDGIDCSLSVGQYEHQEVDEL